MPHTSVISGITGQCGSILAEKLLAKGHRVVGIVRRTSTEYKWRLAGIVDSPNLTLASGDLTDQTSLDAIVKTYNPDYFYNAAAMSHVGVSFNQPVLTGDVTGLGVTRCLEAIKRFAPKCRFLQFSTSELFGDGVEVPQNEGTPFSINSPYACSKIYSFYMTQLYAKMGIFASNMIMFNSESPRRGLEFVTRKITRAVARISLGLQKELVLWDLTPQRDWSSAYDTMDAAIKIVEHAEPDTFIVASGKTHGIVEFLNIAFSHMGLLWEDWVRVDSSKARPVEVPLLCGDASKAKRVLGWEPKCSFKDLVCGMVDADIERAKCGIEY